MHQPLPRPTVRPTPRWLYWSSLLIIGLPILLLLDWLHVRLFGREASGSIGIVFMGVAAGLAAIARFVAHLVWDALTMKPDQPRR